MITSVRARAGRPGLVGAAGGEQEVPDLRPRRNNDDDNNHHNKEIIHNNITNSNTWPDWVDIEIEAEGYR